MPLTRPQVPKFIANHERDVRTVLNTLKVNELIVDPRKAHMFMKEVEFCGHILREGRRSPAPGKWRYITMNPKRGRGIVVMTELPNLYEHQNSNVLISILTHENIF